MEANVGLGLKPLDGLVHLPPVAPPAPPTTQVPSVIGYPMTSASQVVRDYQLTSVVIRGKAAPDAKREGRVYYQEVDAGSVVALLSEVPLYYYDRAPQSVVKVPNLVGLSKSDAEAQLVELKLVPQGKATEARPPRTAKRQEVAKQTPAKDTEVLTGQTVSFEYYAGIPVGRYVGLTKDQALKKIKEDQLTPKVGEGENETENPAERFNIYQQTPQPGEYVWFDESVEAFYYKVARGFQDGDGKLVDARFAAAAVSDGAAPEANLKSAGPRTFIMYNSPRNAGGKETQTTLGWQIRKFPDAAGAKQLYDMMTTPLRQARSVPPSLRVKNDIGATSGALSMDLKTDRNQASSQMNFRIYREVFFISYGRVEPVSGQDFSGESDKIMKKSVELIDLRFPPE
jgi:beta-lactam-binding protein with PASTA domain